MIYVGRYLRDTLIIGLKLHVLNKIAYIISSLLIAKFFLHLLKPTKDYLHKTLLHLSKLILLYEFHIESFI